MEVDFIATEGDLLQEYSCSISPGDDGGCISRAVELRIITIPGMHLQLYTCIVAKIFHTNYWPGILPQL
jgi:hypothetical protein